MNRLLSLHLMFVFSGINCNNDGFDVETDGWKYTSLLKEPISTPQDFFTLVDGKDTTQKLIRLLFDAEYRQSKNIALSTKTPDRDELKSRMLDDDSIGRNYDVPITKVHMHHLFPPHLVRPLQKAIVEKLIHYIRRDPIRKFKRKVKKVKTLGTVAVGLGLVHKELQELKSQKTTVQYRVSGLVDFSSKRHKTYNRDEYLERYKRSDDEMVEDIDGHEYKAVKDYKLVGPESKPESGKHYWPFHESKEEIYEKWNKFPVYKDPDPFHEKVRYLHRSFHELHPELLHIVKDVHGLIGHTTKTKIIDAGPDLESPLVLFGQLIKLADSLIPSIRIRIPFIEYLVKSFHEKSKPKVIYVKQPPKIQYVGLPETYEEPYPEPEPIQINVPITVPIVEPVVVPERVPYPTTDKDSGQYRRHMTIGRDSVSGSRNYEVITNFKLDNPLQRQQKSITSRQNSDYQPHNVQHKYTQMFEEAVQIYKDNQKTTDS